MVSNKQKAFSYHSQICFFFVGALFVFFTNSCGNNGKVQNNPDYDPALVKNQLENFNKKYAKTEDQLIEDYARRYQWNMTKTQTGLRYWIYKKQTGKKAQPLDEVTINYTVNLINGVLVYDSKTDGQKKIILGRSTAESGLEEGLYLMMVGEKAKLIIPSHLAFGLLGDENKIPQKATLIYDLEIVSIQSNK